MAENELKGVAPGGQLWDVGGKVYLVYTVPGTQVRMGWHVTNLEQLGALGAPIARTLTAEQAQQEGFVDFGVRTSLVQFSKDPFEAFVTEYERQAKILPMLKDPEISRRAFGAFMEGRALDISDIADTDYWTSRTPAQREWETFVLQQGGATSPAVQQRLDTTRLGVRDALIRAGYQDPPESMVNFLSDRATTGEWNETQLKDAIQRETDPFAPGASPFAGRNLPEGAQLVRRSDGSFAVRADGKDFTGLGEGQLARFGGADATQRALTGGEWFQVEGTGEHFFRSVNGVWYSVRGPGAQRELARLLGPARAVPQEHIGQVAAPLVGGEGSPFKPGELETTLGAAAAGGSTADLVAGAEPFGGGQSALGGAEKVRQTLLQWLGPFFASGYSQQWIEEWAGKLRQNPDAEEQLVDFLRSQRAVLFPGYEENATYESIAGGWRAMYRKYAGQDPNEADDALFMQLLQANDAAFAEQKLWDAGMERGWSTVVSTAVQGLNQQLGGQVRRSAV